MSSELENKSDDTVRILRPPPRVFTDMLGRNVWMGDIEPVELGLEHEVNTDPYNSADVHKYVPHSVGQWGPPSR